MPENSTKENGEQAPNENTKAFIAAEISKAIGDLPNSSQRSTDSAYHGSEHSGGRNRLVSEIFAEGRNTFVKKIVGIGLGVVSLALVGIAFLFGPMLSEFHYEKFLKAKLNGIYATKVELDNIKKIQTETSNKFVTTSQMAQGLRVLEESVGVMIKPIDTVFYHVRDVSGASDIKILTLKGQLNEIFPQVRGKPSGVIASVTVDSINRMFFNCFRVSVHTGHREETIEPGQLVPVTLSYFRTDWFNLKVRNSINRIGGEGGEFYPPPARYDNISGDVCDQKFRVTIAVMLQKNTEQTVQ